MGHIKNHFLNFGCGLGGDTDENESLHKKQYILVMPQITNIMKCQLSFFQCDFSPALLKKVILLYSSNTNLRTQSLITSDMQQLVVKMMNRRSVTNTMNKNKSTEINRRINAMKQTYSITCSTTNVNLASHPALSISHPSTCCTIWKTRSFIRFNSILPQIFSEEIQQINRRQIAHCTDYLYGVGPWRDCVEYLYTEELHVDFLHFIFLNEKLESNLKVAVIRRLIEVKTEKDNRSVVEEFVTGDTHITFNEGQTLIQFSMLYYKRKLDEC